MSSPITRHEQIWDVQPDLQPRIQMNRLGCEGRRKLVRYDQQSQKVSSQNRLDEAAQLGSG